MRDGLLRLWYWRRASARHAPSSFARTLHLNRLKGQLSHLKNKSLVSIRRVARLETNGGTRREEGVVAVSIDSPRFHKDLTVGEAFALNPRARAVFANFHLGGCSHCAISEFETIEQVAEGYGIPLEMILDTLNALDEEQPVPAGVEKAS